MTNYGWKFVEATAVLLDAGEREAVLGDLAESRCGFLQALYDVAGLALRRHAQLWRHWQPWIAAFGVALPCSFPLMGFSLAVCAMARQSLAGANSSPGLLLDRLVLLAILAWSAGLVMGTLARRTLWASIAASLVPCLFCFSRFYGPRVVTQTPWELLLFVLPAVLGAALGLRCWRIRRVPAILLAALTLALALPAWNQSAWNQSWIISPALIWPGWFLVATAKPRPLPA